MFGKKTLFAAAAVAVLSAAGLGSASAAPWEHRADRIEHRMDRFDHRMDRRIDRIERRHADRFVIERSLRPRSASCRALVSSSNCSTGRSG